MKKPKTGVCRDCGKRIKSTSSRCRSCNGDFLGCFQVPEPPEPEVVVEVSGYTLSPEAAEKLRIIQRGRGKYYCERDRDFNPWNP